MDQNFIAPNNSLTPAPAPVAATDFVTPDFHALFGQIAEKIIEQQEAIIGPVAVERAKSVSGLSIDWPQHDVDVAGDPQAVIDNLVSQYKELFGQIAVETCRDAVSRYVLQLPVEQRPHSLD